MTKFSNLKSVDDNFKKMWLNIILQHPLGCSKIEILKILICWYNCRACSTQEKYETYQESSATFMHFKEDHMRNAQLKPGYNLQLAVEREYVTGFNISSERENDECTCQNGSYLDRSFIATSCIDNYDGENITFHYKRHEDEQLITTAVSAS